MISHVIDKDRRYTYCGESVALLRKDETVLRNPTCRECQQVIIEGLHSRLHYQPWWETQMKTKGMPS